MCFADSFVILDIPIFVVLDVLDLLYSPNSGLLNLSLTFSDCTLLNNEMGVNYAVVSSSGSATISGKPYIHSKMIVSRDKENYNGKEKVAKVENATLVTLANSNSVAEKVMAYYNSPCTLSGAIVMDGEKPLDNITMPNQFEEENTGMIKSIEGTLGSAAKAKTHTASRTGASTRVL